MKCVRLGLNLNGDIEMGANLLRPDNIMIVYDEERGQRFKKKYKM